MFGWKYVTGDAGIDVATVYMEVSRQEVLDIRSRLIEMVANERVNPHHVIISANKVTIHLGRHKFSCEIKGKKPMMHLEIHSTDKLGFNIANIHMADVIARYDWCANVLRENYGIMQPTSQRNCAVFSSMEVNTTFPVTHPISAYERFLSILALVFLKGKGDAKTVLSPAEYKDVLISEGLRCDRGSYRLRIYDKIKDTNKDKAKKKEPLIRLQGAETLIRAEFKYNTKQAIRVDFGNRPFVTITDDMIKNAYQKRFRNYSEKFDAYTDRRLSLTNSYTGPADTVSNIIRRSCCQNQFINYPSIISLIHGFERHYHVPLLFDWADLPKAIKEMLRYRIFCNRFPVEDYMRGFEAALGRDPYAAQDFTHQKELAAEIFNHVLNPHEHCITIYQ